MPTKCIRVALEFIKKDNGINENVIYKELKDIQFKTHLACNRAMTYMYNNDMANIMQKDVGIPKKDDKKIYGKSFSAWIENRMNEIMEGVLSSNVAQTRAFVVSRYKHDKKNGLFKGNVTLSQFKRDMPIILHNKAYKIIETSKGLGVEIGLFNLKKQNDLGIKRLIFLTPRLGASEKSIFRRLMDKSYKLGTGQISYNLRKKKWMITISYTFTKENNQSNIDHNKVMGIDLGIVNVATMSIYDNDKEEYIQMHWKDRAISGIELIAHRQKLEARRKNLSIASKWASDNRIGHGYKNRMIYANKHGDKFNRFKDTFNHKVSRYIVDMAIKYGVGVIQMEDLSGFTNKQSESLLKNWSYYDLQNKIIYKAEEHEIKVNLINPKYTSKRCSQCGNIDDANRDCKKDQAHFKCSVCSYSDNADINASKNIAIIDIDNIIKRYLKENII